jgi:TusA-related sulfurtransferase
MRRIKTIKINNEHYQVDMRGWMCPYPKYVVEMLIKKLNNGSQMDMLVDCPSATEDVPKVAKKMGCKVPEINKIRNGEWEIIIQK